MSLATEYDQWHTKVLESAPDHPDESSPWYKLVLEFLPPVEGKRILEVACGRGGFSRLLASKGAIVCGADFSESAIGIAKEKLLRDPALADRVTYVQADAQNLPFNEGSFDVVVSCETIEHVPDPRAAVREMYRVCKPGGLLYLTTPNYLNFMGLYLIYAKVVHPGLKSSQPLDRRHLFPQVRQHVTKAGWKIMRTDGTVHQFPFIPRRNPVQFPSLETNHTIRKLLSPFAYHYFVIARKGSAV
jgi:2-polyprenyl-3-methyl-5-hydroxy-6-metoxy-1,4-benzoquinol methylase